MFIGAILHKDLIRAICYFAWILAWAAYLRHGWKYWNFKQCKDTFDDAFSVDSSEEYNGHADDIELTNLITKQEEASKNERFDTVADIRRLIPKIANRGNVSKKFREELKTRYPYLDIK